MNILQKALKSAIQNSNSEKLVDVNGYFSNYYNKWKNTCHEGNFNSYSSIPKFYDPISEDCESLQWKLRDEARSLFLQRRSMKLLENEELNLLLSLLEENSSKEEERSIDYTSFKRVTQELGHNCEEILSVSAFCKFLKSGSCTVNTIDIFNYAMRKVWLEQTRIGLSLYDSRGKGYLRETDLESYIVDLIPTLSQLQALEKSFHSFYSCTVVRKFMFFLDVNRTGIIKIRDILASGFLDDLLDLRDQSAPTNDETNWFSAQSALRVYGDYLSLDTDHNGMLSKEELSKFGTGTLTQAFLNRLFQECITYSGEMDYRSYLDFILAFENKEEPQSLMYFFRILDMDCKGYLDAMTVKYFFNAVYHQLDSKHQEMVNTDDVTCEIFDIVKPIDPCKITFKDILKCGQGKTIVSILIDVDGFWSHENND